MSASSDTVLEVDNCSLAFGPVSVLRNVTVEVLQGQKVVLIGPSGSGKSTLLRCMNGLETPDRGTVKYRGENINSSAKALQKARLKSEMIFQNFNLYSNKTVLENVMFAPVHLLGLSTMEAHDAALKALSDLKVEHLIDSLPHQLSGGQQQRVAIARALVKAPDILLLDEPTSALDPELIQSVLTAIEDIVQSGMTMVCVTHELGFARRLADRVLFLADGEIVEQGPPTNMFSAPRSDRLRQFLSQVDASNC